MSASTQLAGLHSLPLPGRDDLTTDQARGAACVWDSAPLDTAAAVDLGERKAADGTAYFPRACRPCALQKAMDALVAHGQSCGQCLADHTRCPVGLELVRAVREARR
ncbi:hypothetical protein [Streptomyces sp. NPDC013455]|uniref:hypothetical protein n=1 Tax=Streptomyces sp. NPDC013455 TaxID=3155605 RepID=UPI0033C20DAA